MIRSHRLISALSHSYAYFLCGRTPPPHFPHRRFCAPSHPLLFMSPRSTRSPSASGATSPSGSLTSSLLGTRPSRSLFSSCSTGAPTSTSQPTTSDPPRHTRLPYPPPIRPGKKITAYVYIHTDIKRAPPSTFLPALLLFAPSRPSSARRSDPHLVGWSPASFKGL